jgi:glycosyltransferase involved in cell wall biosynthesis
MVEISVIIPTYNVEKYIEECLDSVINQTFEDIEIICIDDKSSDNTYNILKEYCIKDSRIKLYQNSQNLGIADTRNFSLKIAKGKYIYFLDSDDYIELDALETFYKLAEEKSLDILMFKIANFADHTRIEYTDYYTEMYYLKFVKDEVFSYEDIKPYIIEICVNLPGKFFRRDLICDIEFPSGFIFEDVPFFAEALFKAKRIYFLRQYLYHKRWRKKSIMTTRDIKFLMFTDILDMTFDVFKKYGYYDELKCFLYQHMIWSNLVMMTKIVSFTRLCYYKKMRSNFIYHKNDVEDIWDDLYLKYQILYDVCIRSNNYFTFLLRWYYNYLKNFKQVRKEIKIENSMWKDKD